MKAAQDNPRRLRASHVFWAVIVVAVLTAGLIVKYLPPAVKATQQLSTSFTVGDYTVPVGLSDASLVVEQAAGLNGEIRTHVQLTVDGSPADGVTFGPDLFARLTNDTGGTMDCLGPWRSKRLDGTPQDYYLECDRTVSTDEATSWISAVVTVCRANQHFVELRDVQPCGESFITNSG